MSEHLTTQDLHLPVGHGITVLVDTIPERNVEELGQSFTIAA